MLLQEVYNKFHLIKFLSAGEFFISLTKIKNMLHLSWRFFHFIQPSTGSLPGF